MRRKFYLGLPALVTLFLCVSLSSCDQISNSEAKFEETAFKSESSKHPVGHSTPLSLRLVVNDTYCKITACECIHYLASREYEELLNMLKKDYKIELELIYCIEEFHLEDSIKTGSFDGAICKPWFAFQFQQNPEMNFTRLVDVLDPFENEFLAGTFIVRKESPIQEPADINGKTLVMGEENSYEKYHSPMHLITETGISPGKIKKVSACTEGINALLDNEAEIAVISDYALIASCAADFAEEDAFRAIWQTEDLPLCSLILDLNRVKKQDAARLQAALLEISENKIPESFASRGFIKPMPWTPKPFAETQKEI